MEDALISKLGLSVLTGAGLIEAAAEKTVVVPRRDVVNGESLEAGKIEVDMVAAGKVTAGNPVAANMDVYGYVMNGDEMVAIEAKGTVEDNKITFTHAGAKIGETSVLTVVYYQNRTSGATSVEITPDKFAGYYRIEAQTLGRRMDGADFPMVITIPKAKVQSAFSLAFAPTGDPSSFNFTIDAFPDYVYPTSTNKSFVVMDLLD